MCRPGSSFVRQLTVGAIIALAVGGCGKGLYTRAGQFHGGDGGGGGTTDPGSSTGSGGAAGGGTGSGTGTGTSIDASVPPDSNPTKVPDASPKLDGEPGACKPELVSNGEKADIRCGDATLTIPKESVPTGGPYRVTLSLVSTDGTLTLTNGDGTKQRYGGTIGPIYSISAEFSLRGTATLRIRVVPDASISPQRMGLAYVNTDSKIWVVAPESAFDASTNEVIGAVTNPSGKYYFAPVETCTREGQDGGACHLGSLKCKGEACQE